MFELWFLLLSCASSRLARLISRFIKLAGLLLIYTTNKQSTNTNKQTNVNGWEDLEGQISRRIKVTARDIVRNHGGQIAQLNDYYDVVQREWHDIFRLGL